MVKRGDMMTIDDIIDILAIDLVGVVPDDENIIISTNRGEPVASDMNSRAGQAYRNITKRLMGEQIPIMDLEIDKGFMDRLRKLFGMKA
jgi:septum site-determining protein MinD